MIKKKIFYNLIILTVICVCMCNVCTAAVNIDNIKNDSSVSGTGTIKEMGKTVYSIITTIGIVASVVVLAIIGLTYMLGSIEKKAEYKKTLMPYVIGCALIFGASTIANVLYEFAK